MKFNHIKNLSSANVCYATFFWPKWPLKNTKKESRMYAIKIPNNNLESTVVFLIAAISKKLIVKASNIRKSKSRPNKNKLAN